jgi:hypothetical protein
MTLVEAACAKANIAWGLDSATTTTTAVAAASALRSAQRNVVTLRQDVGQIRTIRAEEDGVIDERQRIAREDLRLGPKPESLDENVRPFCIIRQALNSLKTGPQSVPPYALRPRLRGRSKPMKHPATMF